MLIARVALDVPLYREFDYRAPDATAADIGCRVLVPFGRGSGEGRERVGIITAVEDKAEADVGDLKTVGAILRGDPDSRSFMPPLSPAWFRLCRFCSDYYHAPLGEVMLSTLPTHLKRIDPPAMRKIGKSKKTGQPVPPESVQLPDLTRDQAVACTEIAASLQAYRTFLLFGITGSGKTEVYLQLAARVLEQGRQVLLLVPEINLTPQLEQRVAARFPMVELVSLHSELTDAARCRNWLAAWRGEARIVLGTRLAVLAPLPELGLIIVDEEHDTSYKQQDGMRYSARDVAVFRAHDLDIPVVLGSATPSLESWAKSKNGRYRSLELKERAVSGASLPRIAIRDVRNEALNEGVSPVLLAAVEQRLARGEQSLIFLNRRGYAPVLACPACAWASQCHRCAARLVVHLADRRLRCHHCGLEVFIPKACPDCGNQDIHPFGRGTQRLEEFFNQCLPQARILRIDRDSAKSRKQWEVLQAQIHAGDADILIGTQMLSKGHDFPRLTLVGVLGADAALFAADWRAPERLFAQLMQVAGRAGRAEWPGEVIVQTRYPEHPLYHALAEHDYPRFADGELKTRHTARFPPYSFQAMLRAEAKTMEAALAFLRAARNWPGTADCPLVTCYDPVPMHLPRRATLERAQLLVESPSRPALQAFLGGWREYIDRLKSPAHLRWHLEVDPLEF